MCPTCVAAVEQGVRFEKEHCVDTETHRLVSRGPLPRTTDATPARPALGPFLERGQGGYLRPVHTPTLLLKT